MESVQKLAVKDLGISGHQTLFSKMDRLHSWLAGEIAILLDRDINGLMNVLYRIDVSEEKVRMAFAGDNPAFDIAGLIIEKELKKVETRRKYRGLD